MTTDSTPRERAPFLEAVGRVTVAGAHLDRYLHSLLGAITFEPTLLDLANAENTSKLIEWCEVALRRAVNIDPDDVADAKACLARAKALKDKRHTVVHSLFLDAGEGDGLHALKPARRRIGNQATPFTVEDMESVAEEIYVLCGDLFNVSWNIRSASSGMDRMSRPGEEGAPSTSS